MLNNMLGDPGHVWHSGQHNPSFNLQQARARLFEQAFLREILWPALVWAKTRIPRSEPLAAPKVLAVDCFKFGEIFARNAWPAQERNRIGGQARSDSNFAFWIAGVKSGARRLPDPPANLRFRQDQNQEARRQHGGFGSGLVREDRGGVVIHLTRYLRLGLVPEEDIHSMSRFWTVSQKPCFLGHFKGRAGVGQDLFANSSTGLLNATMSPYSSKMRTASSSDCPPTRVSKGAGVRPPGPLTGGLGFPMPSLTRQALAPAFPVFTASFLLPPELPLPFLPFPTPLFAFPTLKISTFKIVTLLVWRGQGTEGYISLLNFNHFCYRWGWRSRGRAENLYR